MSKESESKTSGIVSSRRRVIGSLTTLATVGAGSAAAVSGRGWRWGGGRGRGRGGSNGDSPAETTFSVTIENVSDGMTLETSAAGEAAEQPVPLSPGAYATHKRGEPIFSAGDPERMNGLEEIAEDGSPGLLGGSLGGQKKVEDSGVFTTPIGADSPGPLLPGHSYGFEVTATRAAKHLSLVTMFIPSNDLFYSLGGPEGLRVYDGGNPVSGDVTEHVGLWDAGTEINEEPGVGPNQAQRQPAKGVGLVERGTVAPIEDVNGYDYPATEDVIRVTLSPQ